MTYKIDEDCISCTACELECPTGAIKRGEITDLFLDGSLRLAAAHQYIIDPRFCNDCGACEKICPTGSCKPG